MEVVSNSFRHHRFLRLFYHREFRVYGILVAGFALLRVSFIGDCYDKACRQLGLALKNHNDLDLEPLSSLGVSLILNLAACFIKIQAFEEALNFCSLVLSFFPSNVKAVFRKAVALKNLKRFSEAKDSLEEASALEPHNRDIIRELEEVGKALEINQNGKRIVVDLLDANENRVGKNCAPSFQSQEASVGQNTCEVSASASPNLHSIDTVTLPVEFMDLGSSSEVCNKDCSSELCASLTEVPMDSGNLRDSLAPSPDASHLPPSDHDKYTFSNKNHNHKKMRLSSGDYNSLMHGKDIQFYHPKSGAFLRVRPLNQKTTQLGTLRDDKSWEAAVPTSPSSELGHSRDAICPSSNPFPEECHQDAHLRSVANVTFVQEEFSFQINKKNRLPSGSSYATQVSMVQFKFEAVKAECSSNQTCRKENRFFKRSQISRGSINLKRRTVVSTTRLTSVCRYYTSFIAGKKTKRHEGYPIQFDDHFPPFKKSR